MAGFIRSVMSGLAATALFNGITKVVSANNQPAAPVLTPMPVPQTAAPYEGGDAPLSEQRIFGIPGASLYTANNLGVEAREAGIHGETRVAKELKFQASRYPNMYVFHSVKLPGKIGDIDHLVIQGDRMLLVDSKNWKHDAAYHIYHSTFEADYISRDGQDFVGGEIHLTRQIAEWQVEFMDSSLDVQGVLVIANRQSTVSENINAPYSIANIDGLATIFQNLFSMEEQPPMHPALLNRLLSMTQQATSVQPVMPPGMVASPPKIKQPATTATKWFVGWSFFNYTVMLLLFPLAGFSALPLLFLTHRHQAYVKANNLGGSGLLTTVLTFTYILLIGWAMTVIMVALYWLRYSSAA